MKVKAKLADFTLYLEADMDKFIAAAKGVGAVAAAVVATLGTGADLHNPMTWLALVIAIEHGLGAVFHWQQG